MYEKSNVKELPNFNRDCKVVSDSAGPRERADSLITSFKPFEQIEE